MFDEIFKEWHAEDFSFHKDTNIAFSQCTPNRNISWAEILRFTSDNAGEDFSKRGMDWKSLYEKRIVFIVSRTSFHVHKMPVADQRITFNTYECAPQGPLAMRYYELVDTKTQEVLVSASSAWSILDPVERKMVPAKNFDLRPTPTTPINFEGLPPARIKTPENCEVFGKHKIRFSDLDANGHTNNSKYINFVFDVLPEEYQNKLYTDLKLNYSKEAMLGEEMILKGFIDEENKKITMIGIIEDQNSFECELYW